MEMRLQERKARFQDYCKRHKRNADAVLGKDLHYFNVFCSRKPYRPNATRQALETGSGVTFSEFTKYLVEIRRWDEHWQAFDKLCHPCAMTLYVVSKISLKMLVI